MTANHLIFNEAPWRKYHQHLSLTQFMFRQRPIRSKTQVLPVLRILSSPLFTWSTGQHALCSVSERDLLELLCAFCDFHSSRKLGAVFVARTGTGTRTRREIANCLPIWRSQYWPFIRISIDLQLRLLVVNFRSHNCRLMVILAIVVGFGGPHK